MKKITRYIGLFLIVLNLLCVRWNTHVYATVHSFDFITDGDNKNSTFDALDSKTRLTSKSGYKLALSISLVIAIISIIATGIRLACCSKEEKAEAKRKLLPLILACCGIFAVVGIVGLAYDIGSKIFG